MIIWVVRLGDDLYVRSVNGPSAAWFRGTRAHPEGHIRAGGVDKDVAFVVVDAADQLNDQIDAADRLSGGERPGGPGVPGPASGRGDAAHADQTEPTARRPPVAGAVLDQDRHDLAGGVVVEPAMGVLLDSLHYSCCARLRRPAEHAAIAHVAQRLSVRSRTPPPRPGRGGGASRRSLAQQE